MLAIDGFTLVPAPNLPGGKYVVFETAAGQLILNGTALAPPPKQLSEAAGEGYRPGVQAW